MQYIALIYTADDCGSPNPGEPGFDEYMGGYIAATETYKETGCMIAGEALQPTSTATSIRIRDGKTETMDGPFAETKERLGGFYLLECRDLDHAIEMAALIPDAKYGTVEVRPILDLSDMT